ncbi:hypothetical protein Q5P01_007758 [Channa striata]|uniref:Toll-like receptor 7 n=1 Tax=Channa striata TaxID=64152 RepID=A0AA88N7D6_CHASR|nr:hypothetical protein Q5P01_007758 [Channa striata]
MTTCFHFCINDSDFLQTAQTHNLPCLDKRLLHLSLSGIFEMHVPAMALLRNIIIFSQILSLAISINMHFFPCDSDVNATTVDCYDRPLNRVPAINGCNGGERVNGVIRQAFFMVQQRLLDEKVDTAVLVLLDEMFPKLKYLQLRKRLCKKSVLSWPKNPRAQPLFWNRMRMALSSDNLKFYDNNMSESFI